MEYLMRLQSRACIAYLIHLNRRGAISNSNLQEGIREFSKVMRQASPSPPSAPKPPMPAPPVSSVDREKRIKRNKKKKEKRRKQNYAHLKQLRLEKSQQQNILSIFIFLNLWHLTLYIYRCFSLVLLAPQSTHTLYLA